MVEEEESRRDRRRKLGGGGGGGARFVLLQLRFHVATRCCLDLLDDNLFFTTQHHHFGFPITSPSLGGGEKSFQKHHVSPYLRWHFFSTGHLRFSPNTNVIIHDTCSPVP